MANTASVSSSSCSCSPNSWRRSGAHTKRENSCSGGGAGEVWGTWGWPDGRLEGFEVQGPHWVLARTGLMGAVARVAGAACGVKFRAHAVLVG